jgi:hypothetical protein
MIASIPKANRFFGDPNKILMLITQVISIVTNALNAWFGFVANNIGPSV